MYEERGRFTAVDESGREYTIVVRVRLLDASTAQTPGATSDGPKRLETTDGRVLRRIARGQYETLDGVELTSDDPDAP